MNYCILCFLVQLPLRKRNQFAVAGCVAVSQNWKHVPPARPCVQAGEGIWSWWIKVTPVEHFVFLRRNIPGKKGVSLAKLTIAATLQLLLFDSYLGLQHWLVLDSHWHHPLSEAGVAGVCESRSVLNVPVRHQVESHLEKGSHDKSDSQPFKFSSFFLKILSFLIYTTIKKILGFLELR